MDKDITVSQLVQKCYRLDAPLYKERPRIYQLIISDDQIKVKANKSNDSQKNDPQQNPEKCTTEPLKSAAKKIDQSIRKPYKFFGRWTFLDIMARGFVASVSMFIIYNWCKNSVKPLFDGNSFFNYGVTK